MLTEVRKYILKKEQEQASGGGAREGRSCRLRQTLSPLQELRRYKVALEAEEDWAPLWEPLQDLVRLGTVKWPGHCSPAMAAQPVGALKI
jgi:hypothetical protein